MEKKKMTPELEERVKEVKKDNAVTKESANGVDQKTVVQDVNMINPDCDSLDRG